VSPSSNHNQDIFWELLFSLPTTRLTSVVTWSINTLLILLAADFVFTPVFDSATDVTFTRLGAVYTDAVKVVVRYPLSEPGATEHYVRVQWRRPVTAAADDRWKDGPILHLGPESDWTNATKLTKLWPSTEYEYTLADVERKILPYPNSPIRFHTFPDSRLSTGSHFRFVVSSCLKPNFPYAPFQNRRIKGFDLLADYLFPEPTVVDTPEPETVPDFPASDNSTESLNPLEFDVDILANSSIPAVQDAILAAIAERPVPTEFMLFLGDFVYADVPIYHGDSANAYRRLYRRNYNSPSFRKIYERLRAFVHSRLFCICMILALSHHPHL
jgi:alkaline phosphatase D